MSWENVLILSCFALTFGLWAFFLVMWLMSRRK